MDNNKIPSKTHIIKVRQWHPDWPLARIGGEVGLSRQRVYQVLKTAGLPTSTRGKKFNVAAGIVKKHNPTATISKGQNNYRRRMKTEPFVAGFSKVPIEEAMAMKRPKTRATVLEEFKKYVVSLGPREAGKFEVSNDREGQMLRTRIKWSAAALGLDVKVRKVRNEILFWHENSM